MIHDRYVHGRRVNVLARHLANLLPEKSSVLDVGCGDGRLGASLAGQRPDISIQGLEVLVRPETQIKALPFDGRNIPCEDSSWDVLHHADDPVALIRESCRVSRRSVIIKDHQLRGILAFRTLKFMDWMGNARHGVTLPYRYWTFEQWECAFRDLGLKETFRKENLGLYIWPLSCFFDRNLHFLACLEVGGKVSK